MAKPKSTGEIEHTFTHLELKDAKDELEYLARERQYLDTMTRVEISRLFLQFKQLFEPVNMAIVSLIEEHGEGEEGEKIIKPGTVNMRRYQMALADLMKKGEVKATFKPIAYDSLKVKRRNPAGEREDEIIDLSPEQIGKLGPLLAF